MSKNICIIYYQWVYIHKISIFCTQWYYTNVFKWRSHIRCYIMYIYYILCVAYPSNFEYRTLGWNECIIGSHAYTAPIQLAVMRFYSRSLFRLEISLIRFQICLVQHTKNIWYVWYVNNIEFNPCNRKKRSKSILWMRNAVCW